MQKDPTRNLTLTALNVKSESKAGMKLADVLKRR